MAGTIGRVAPGGGARQTLSEPAGNVWCVPVAPGGALCFMSTFLWPFYEGLKGPFMRSRPFYEGLIQLKKAHCDNAWPIAANAAIRAYLNPNEVRLS